MYNWVTTRKIPRTDAPNYPARATQTVDATVRTWMPATVALLACFVTSARADFDQRYYESPTYPVRATQTVDVTVRTWQPAVDAPQRSFRTDARPPLDIRQYDWAPAFTGPTQVVDATVRTWAAIWSQPSTSYRTTDRAKLDVRSYEWTEPSWIVATLPPTLTTAQAWPAILEGVGLSYRTDARPPLDVRRYEWAPDDGWIVPTVNTTIAKWAPVFAVPTVAIPAARPTTAGTVDVGWIGVTLSAGPSVAQTWPAVLEASGLSYRTGERPKLDGRAYDWAPPFTWVTPIIDASVQRWLVATTAEPSFRLSEGRRLDVRGYEWQPESGWIASALPPVATTAQIWPAILQNLGTQYRTIERGKLDVRTYEWPPAFGWAPKVVDTTLAKWAPVFLAELSARTDDRARIDVRRITDAPELAWQIAFLPTGLRALPTQFFVVPAQDRTFVVDAPGRSTSVAAKQATFTVDAQGRFIDVAKQDRSFEVDE